MLNEWPPDLVRFCRERDVNVIGRVHFDPQPLGPEGSRNIGRVIEALRSAPGVGYWEFYNECWQNGPDARRYAELSIECAVEIKKHGRVPVMGCFSVGQPQTVENRPAHYREDDWEHLLLMVLWAGANGGKIGMHQYGRTFQWGVGENQERNLVDGRWVHFDPVERRDVKGYFALRHRYDIEAWKRLGATRLPGILITESGPFDNINPHPRDSGGKGWREFLGTGYLPHPFYGGFAEQNGWYCRQLGYDELVEGVVGFGWGTDGHPDQGVAQWWNFDLSAEPTVLGQTIAVMRSLPRGSEKENTVDPFQVALFELLDKEHRESGIRSHAGAALWDAGTSDGWMAVTNEMGLPVQGGLTYAVQRFQHTKTERIRDLYTHGPDWVGNVRMYEYAKGESPKA